MKKKSLIFKIIEIVLIVVSLALSAWAGVNTYKTRAMKFNTYRVYKERGMVFIDIKTAKNIDLSTVEVYIASYYYADGVLNETSFKCEEIEFVQKSVTEEYVSTFEIKKEYMSIADVYAEDIDGNMIDFYEDEEIYKHKSYLVQTIVYSSVALVVIVAFIVVAIVSRKKKMKTTKAVEVANQTEIQDSKKHSKFVICEFCGSENEPTARKCESCGASLKNSRKKK